MTYPVRRAVIVGTTVTLGALIALFASSGIRARVLDAYLVAIGGVVMLMLIRTVRALLPDRRVSPFDAALAGMREPVRKSGELSIERDVQLSRLNAFHFHMRLRPVLREVAAMRLRRHYGVDLDLEPARAQELVPSAAWEVVHVQRPPEDRLAPGPSLAKLREVVTELERL